MVEGTRGSILFPCVENAKKSQTAGEIRGIREEIKMIVRKLSSSYG